MTRVLCFKGQRPDLHVTVLTRDLHRRIIATEGEASPLLLRLCRLQKIHMIGNPLHLPKGFHRCNEIGQNLAGNRYALVNAAFCILFYFL